MRDYGFEMDETPPALRDADVEMAGLEAIGRRVAALRKRGICAHGWVQGAPGSAANFDASPVTCHECGAVFPTGLAWGAARDAALRGAR